MQSLGRQNLTASLTIRDYGLTDDEIVVNVVVVLVGANPATLDE